MKHFILILIIIMIFFSCGSPNNENEKIEEIPTNNQESSQDTFIREYIKEHNIKEPKFIIPNDRDYLIQDSVETIKIELGDLDKDDIWLSILEGHGNVEYIPESEMYKITTSSNIDTALFNIRLAINDSLVIGYGNFKIPVKSK